MASLGLAESQLLLGADRQQHKWSIPARRIAMKYLLAVKGGMDPRQWAQLHPADWKRRSRTNDKHLEAILAVKSEIDRLVE